MGGQVDTEALGVYLGCSAAMVRLLVSVGVIAPAARRTRRGKGRPTMWFDLDAVEADMISAEASGRVARVGDHWRVARNGTRVR